MEWHKVTWYSTLAAIILFFGVYALGFYIGIAYERVQEVKFVQPPTAIVNENGAAAITSGVTDAHEATTTCSNCDKVPIPI